MSRVAGDFLGETLAGDGAISDAPELTEDVEPGPSGGDFRSTCGIGIGGTNLSSLCATGIANGAKKPDAGGGTSGAARAWLSQSMGQYDGTEQRLRHPVSGMAADVTRRSGTSAPRSRANWSTITEIRVKRAPLSL
jgi:hypothetical protein